jgi:hypothetical protein
MSRYPRFDWAGAATEYPPKSYLTSLDNLAIVETGKGERVNGAVFGGTTLGRACLFLFRKDSADSEHGCSDMV